MSENPHVSQGMPSEKLIALNTITYQTMVTTIGIQYMVIVHSPKTKVLNQLSRFMMPPNIWEIYEILMLVSQMMAPTVICMIRRAIGGILIGLFPIVSRSSTKDMREIIPQRISTIISRFSKRGEKLAKTNNAGLKSTSNKNTAIPAQ